MTRSLLLLSLVLITSSGCVSIPNTRACTAKGLVSDGAICVESNTHVTSEISFDEFIRFLEAQPDSEDTAHPGQIIQGHGSAMCESAEDWNKKKTLIEQMCRILGKRCSYEQMMETQ